MIKSFRHKGLAAFFYTDSKKGIRPEHANRLERILDRLNPNAAKVEGAADPRRQG